MVQEITGDALADQLRAAAPAQLGDALVDAYDRSVLRHDDAFDRRIDELLHGLDVVMDRLPVDQRGDEPDPENDQRGADGNRRQQPVVRIGRRASAERLGDDARGLDAGEVQD